MGSTGRGGNTTIGPTATATYIYFIHTNGLVNFYELEETDARRIRKVRTYSALFFQ